MEKKFKVTVDGREYIVTVEDISDDSSLIYPDPGSMNIPSSIPSGTATPVKPAAVAAAGDETSPLAGIIKKIDVAVGHRVKEGERIAQIEAMKMITPLIAHRSGTVTYIHVKVGDVIDAGQPVLTIG